MRRLYFPNLNGLRFIAAAMVLFPHIEQIKSWFHADHLPVIDYPARLGNLGVVLFFVLSGFLITYLLLQEKRNSDSIRISHFYVRRILRIWPLYYLVILLSLFVWPQVDFLVASDLTPLVEQNFQPKLLFYLFLLPNLALLTYPAVPFASQAWSIGIEEQFYLLWPLVVKLSRRILGALLTVLAVGLALRHVLGPVGAQISNPLVSQLNNILQGLVYFNCMSLGGIAAYLAFNNKKKLLVVLYNKIIQALAYILAVACIIEDTEIGYVTIEFYALLFAIITLNLATNKNSILNLENRPLRYLGKISYGIYMYHPLAIAVSIGILKMISLLNNPAVYILSFSVTILMAATSYRFFEAPILKAKVKFSRVITGDGALTAKG